MNKIKCFALDLKDDADLIAAYEHYHRPENAWPEIVTSIFTAGIAEMKIFRTGNRLLMVVEVTDTFDEAAKAKADTGNPKVQEWEQLMDQFQQPLPWAEAGQKWVPMAEIYSLQTTRAHLKL